MHVVAKVRRPNFAAQRLLRLEIGDWARRGVVARVASHWFEDRKAGIRSCMSGCAMHFPLLLRSCLSRLLPGCKNV